MKTIKPIKNDKDLEAACNRLDEIFNARAGTKEGDELEILSILIEKYEDEHYTIPDPDHTVWTVEVEAISKVFATEAEAQKYIDFTNKKDIFKVKKLDVNPARKPKQSVIPGVKPKGWKWPQSYRDDTGASYQFE